MRCGRSGNKRVALPLFFCGRFTSAVKSTDVCSKLIVPSPTRAKDNSMSGVLRPASLEDGNDANKSRSKAGMQGKILGSAVIEVATLDAEYTR